LAVTFAVLSLDSVFDSARACGPFLFLARIIPSLSKHLKPPAKEPEHYLKPKHLSRIAHGQHKGERGYDPNQRQQYWDTAWHSLTDKAGFPGLRFPDLRHTFHYPHGQKGVAIGVIQTFVGHMSERMVRHYTHVSSGAARKAVELLDQAPSWLQ